METHSNKMLVGAILAILIAAGVAFALWMTANKRSTGRPFDIVMEQSVSGLIVGSPVTYLGVPVGRVVSIELDPVQRGAVRVRIDITDDNLPIAQGTVARLSGDLLFGTALLSLEHASHSAPPLLARAGEEVPRIPIQSGGMGDLMSDPTPMVEQIAYATDRLLAATTPEQQAILTARLQEMERTSADMAARAPSLATRVAAARQSLRASAASSADVARKAAEMERRLDRRSGSATRELRASLAGARDGTEALNARLQAARPAVRSFSESAAGTGERIAAARQGLDALQEQVEKVERGGVGALMSGPPTPDYEPRERR